MAPQRKIGLVAAVAAALCLGLCLGLGLIVAPGLVDRMSDELNRPQFGPVTGTVDAEFKPYAPEPGQTGAESLAEAERQQKALNRLAGQIRTGTVPEALISEGADDAPLREGEYYYTRFDPVEGPFVRDIPPMGQRVVCFAGRVGGKSRHVVVLVNGDNVQARDPETLNGWVFSNCSDGLRFRKARLSERQYLKMRLSLLPEKPAYDVQRAALRARLKAVRWRLW